MTYEELMKDIEELKELKEKYQNGEIEDPWSPECRANWTEKCNA